MRLFTLLVLAAVACRREPPPRTMDVVPPPAIAWAFDAPDSWGESVQLVNATPTSGSRSTRSFTYAPAAKGQSTASLLSIAVYDSATWASRVPSARVDSLASESGNIFAVSVADTNPYPKGSRDARMFASLLVDLSTVRKAFRVIK